MLAQPKKMMSSKHHYIERYSQSDIDLPPTFSDVTKADRRHRQRQAGRQASVSCLSMEVTRARQWCQGSLKESVLFFSKVLICTAFRVLSVTMKQLDNTCHECTISAPLSPHIKRLLSAFTKCLTLFKQQLGILRKLNRCSGLWPAGNASRICLYSHLMRASRSYDSLIITASFHYDALRFTLFFSSLMVNACDCKATDLKWFSWNWYFKKFSVFNLMICCQKDRKLSLIFAIVKSAAPGSEFSSDVAAF